MSTPQDIRQLSALAPAAESSVTLAWYEANARDYAARADAIDMSSHRDRFLALLPARSRILDVGCGSGRDLKAFRQAGHRSEGLEPSVALADIARESSGCPVRVQALPDSEDVNSFDGIWACASLLHLPKYRMGPVLRLLSQCLLMDGHLVVHLKEGKTEGIEPCGRFFSRWTPGELLVLACEQAPALSCQSLAHNMSEDGTRWLSFTWKRVRR